MTINGLNKWTPAIYSSTAPGDWAAERNKSIDFGKTTKAIPNKRNNSVLFKGK